VSLVLLTNDDGIEAEGLKCLEDALRGLADILVVAPDRERSAISHALTIHTTLELIKVSKNRYTINGTPADCIIYALTHLTQRPPHLVISGINHGANLGDDIMYSGTVAAAREASRHGVPSLAVSQAYGDAPIRFDRGAKFIRNLAKMMLDLRGGAGMCLNVNIPVGKVRGVVVTRQGCTSHFPHFNSLDLRPPPGGRYRRRDDKAVRSAITLDFKAIIENYISVTPLQRDQTDYTTVQSLLKDTSRLFQ
jgi:5'-nucleotidase